MTRRTRPDRPTLAEDVASAIAAEKWKPGDVATITYGDGKFTDVAVRLYPRDWSVGEGVVRDASVTQARPLVVIDPEGSDVNRLVIRLGLRYNGSCREMRETLRDLHTDPKPDEPTGLGAVVEDAKGWRWIRIYAPVGYQWQYLSERADYDDIDAVRVLSEGVWP